MLRRVMITLVLVNEILKLSVMICRQSYRHKYIATFLWTTVYMINVIMMGVNNASGFPCVTKSNIERSETECYEAGRSPD